MLGGPPVDQDELAFAAHHLRHDRGLLQGAGAVEGDVGDDQDAFAGDRDPGRVGDDDGAVEAAESLLGDQAVVVRVIPVHAGRVIGGSW